MLLDELIYETNTPVERKLHDLESRFHLMCLAPSRRDLFEFYVHRFDIAAMRAKANFEVFRSQLVNETNKDELDRLAASLIETVLIVEEMAGRRARGADMPWLVETIKGEIEEMVSSLLEDSNLFRKSIDQALQSVDAEQLPSLDRALKIIRDSVGEMGLERQEMLRDARAHFRDLLEVPGSPAEPVLWFYQGWLSWMRHLDPEEVRELFFRACLGGTKRKDTVFWLSCRYLAFVQHETGHSEEAYVAIKQALSVRVDAETLIEAVRYATATDRGDEVKVLARRCLDISPLHSLIMLSESEVEW